MPSEAQAITSLVETGMIGRIGHVNWQNRLCGLAEQLEQVIYVDWQNRLSMWTGRTGYMDWKNMLSVWTGRTGYMD